VKEAESGNSGVVNEGSLQQRRTSDALEGAEIALAFGKESARKARQEPSYRIQRYVDGRGVPKDAWIGYHRQKFVDAGPWNADGFRSRDRVGEDLTRAFIEGHLGAMRVHEQARVDGNHEPCSR
jgi:hypothetical protein